MPNQNDLIACNLLKRVDHYVQFAVLYSLETAMLKRIFEAAILNEEYEICQVINSLMEERLLPRLSDNGNH